MNLLFFADNFFPETNAQASRVYERACYWVKWGHKVTVITCTPNFPEGKVFEGYANNWHQIERVSGIRVVRVKTYIAPNSGKYRRSVDFLSYMAASFVAALFEEKPDLVVATSPQFFAALGSCLLAWLRSVPFVLELSDLWPESVVAVGAMKRGFVLRCLEQIELWMYKRTARIVALTSAFKANLVRRGVDATKIGVVLNGVDLERYVPRQRDIELARRLGIKSGQFVVGYIGTLGMSHALDNVLRTAALDKDRKTMYLLVGPGAERTKLMAEAQRMKLPNVIFVPSQPKETIPDYWSLCDVALVHLRDTPLFETVIPSKIFEAMAMGLPIVLAAPRGEASEIVEGVGAGLWVRPEQPCELLSAVELLRHDELRLRFADRSRAAASKFSRERQAREMLVMLQHATGATTKVTATAA